MFVRVFMAIVSAGSAFVMGAGPAPANAAPYLVWPEAANLGETVGVVVSAQAAIDIAPDFGPLEADAESFVIELEDASGFVEQVQPRSVIEAPAALGSVLAVQEAGRWTGMVLLFDLPATWTQSTLVFGTDELSVSIDYEGQRIVEGEGVLVMGDGGAPLAAAATEAVGELELEPMLRFRPSWEAATGEGFDPTWPIHAVEFVLRYVEPSAGEVQNPSARANGDAATALPLVEELTAPVGEKRWKIAVVDPYGFALAEKGCAGPGDCYAGRWSLLDLVFEKIPETLPEGQPVFAPGDFTIEDVVVFDADGAQLNPPFAGENYFQLHAVNHLVEPTASPPPSVATLVWPEVAYQGDTVAVLFNTEQDASTDPDGALVVASRDDVIVNVEDPDGHSEALTPRAVVELPAAPGAKGLGTPPVSLTGIVAFFEIPDPWPNPSPTYGLPATFHVDVEHNGAATSGSDVVSVVGTGGAAVSFAPVAPLELLGPTPMVRLRPVWDEVALEGFDPAWQIGSLEFALRYTQADVSEVLDLSAVANGEGISGLAMSDRLPDELSDKLWNVMLIAPDGFALPDSEVGSTGDSPIGRWSLIDLIAETDPNGGVGSPIEEAEFAVEDVRVFDLDGVRLNPPYAGEPFFEIRTTTVPEPGVLLQLVAGSAAVLLMGRRRQRRMARR